MIKLDDGAADVTHANADDDQADADPANETVDEAVDEEQSSTDSDEPYSEDTDANYDTNKPPQNSSGAFAIRLMPKKYKYHDRHVTLRSIARSSQYFVSPKTPKPQNPKTPKPHFNIVLYMINAFQLDY